jgi:hypothetical protein
MGLIRRIKRSLGIQARATKVLISKNNWCQECMVWFAFERRATNFSKMSLRRAVNSPPLA